MEGPLPTSPEGVKWIFKVIDHNDQSTRWLDAIPVKNLEATMYRGGCLGRGLDMQIWSASDRPLNLPHKSG